MESGGYGELALRLTTAGIGGWLLGHYFGWYGVGLAAVWGFASGYLWAGNHYQD